MHADAMTAKPAARAHLRAIAPYVGGSAKIAGHAQAVKLSANENILGCSPRARQAFVGAADDLARYPDGNCGLLREALAHLHQIEAGRIICGAGSDEVLTLIALAFSGPGDEVLYSQHGFLIYPIAARQAGATPVAAPESGLTADVDALLAAVTPRTRIVFLANPNNPTGTWVPASEIRRLHAGLPGDCLMVLDGAYAEYLNDPDYEDGLALARTAGNVVVTRTFSKIYGLAALRLGWGYGPAEVVDMLHRLRLPFNANGPAQAAAIAALQDQGFVERSRDFNAGERARVADAARQGGLLATHSAGTFVLLRFGSTPGRDVEAAEQAFHAAGIIPRRVTSYGFPDCLRYTIGLAHHNDAVIDLLAGFFD